MLGSRNIRTYLYMFNIMINIIKNEALDLTPSPPTSAYILCLLYCMNVWMYVNMEEVK